MVATIGGDSYNDRCATPAGPPDIVGERTSLEVGWSEEITRCSMADAMSRWFCP